MRRYLGWSVAFHAVVIAAGAVVAPLSGVFSSSYQPMEIVSVGLIDSAPAPKGQRAEFTPPPVPEPAGDELIPIPAEKDLTLEKVADPIKVPEPKTEKKPEKKPDEKPPRQPESRTRQDERPNPSGEQLAQTDTTGGLSGSISDGEIDGVWGVETSASVNPYHRRGFSLIRSNWRNPVVGPTPRKCVVGFRVKRSGEITDVRLETLSGSRLFDESAVRAVTHTANWDQFPSFWEENEQIIHLEFEYRP
ncbi:MAG TPA: TonB C-terminal domain-containing protein [candidate division Zixibacteria bacterium]